MCIVSVMPSSHLNFCHPLLLLPSIFPSIRVFSNESAVHIRWPEYWNLTLALASILPMSIQCFFFLRLTDLTPCCPRNSQESSPAPQFEGINSSALWFLYGSVLTAICDYWKDHSLDYPDLFGKRCFAFLLFNTLSFFFSFCHWFPARKQSFNFMAEATICGDFRAQEEEIHLWFHLFPFYLPWNDGAGCNDLRFFVVVVF